MGVVDREDILGRIREQLCESHDSESYDDKE